MLLVIHNPSKCHIFRFYKQQLDYANAIKNAQAQAFPIPGQGSAYGPNYAYATGAYGPTGIHQTAGVFPVNKVIVKMKLEREMLDS